MWRCQRENLKEDAIPCCGNKECDALYLKSYYVPNKLYVGDRSTRFKGYYTQTERPKDTAVLTSVKGGGTPCVKIFGFNTQDTVCITGTWINQCYTPTYLSGSGHSFYNIDGSYIGKSHEKLGIKIGCGKYMVPAGLQKMHFKIKDYEETLYIKRNF